MTTSATPSSNPEKAIASELVGAVIELAQAGESEILDVADTAIKNGETNLDKAILAGFKAKVPLVGNSLGEAIVTSIAGLDATAEGAVKTGFDAGIVALQHLQTQLSS